MGEAAAGGILLDTHVWIWVVEGMRADLSDHVIQDVEQASAEGRVLISAISVWEVAMLETRGRMSLSRPIDEWVGAALRAPGVSLLPLTPEIAIESTRLPGVAHGDPADRILIASARLRDLRLVTGDLTIIDYSRSGHVTTLDAKR